MMTSLMSIDQSESQGQKARRHFACAYVLAVLFRSGSLEWRQPGLYLYNLGMTHERVCDASFEETREGDYSRGELKRYLCCC